MDRGLNVSACAATPIVDLGHLDEFTDGDPALERELAELYLATAEGYLGELEHKLRAAQDWRRVAHALNGASRNLGATRVAALAEAAEQAAPAPDVLAGLRHELDVVRRFFAIRGAA